jgi:uncharacterized protein
MKLFPHRGWVARAFTASRESGTNMHRGRFLTAEWRFLAMLNYTVEPALLEPYLPHGTELDTWQGRHYVSLVGFLFLDTRVLGMPVAFHRNFEEINLRFYVGRKVAAGWRRGVVFVRETVPRWAIAVTARVLYNENYAARPMRHRLERRADDPNSLRPDGDVEYGWREGGRWQSLCVSIAGDAQPVAPGSEAEFITEHYWGYTAQRDGSCLEYQVEHPSWPVWECRAASLTCDVAAVYGAPFAAALKRPPSSAFVAAGSPIVVRRGEKI